LAGIRPLVLTRPSGPDPFRSASDRLLSILVSRLARPSGPSRLGGHPPAGVHPALRAWPVQACLRSAPQHLVSRLARPSGPSRLGGHPPAGVHPALRAW